METPGPSCLYLSTVERMYTTLIVYVRLICIINGLCTVISFILLLVNGLLILYSRYFLLGANFGLVAYLQNFNHKIYCTNKHMNPVMLIIEEKLLSAKIYSAKNYWHTFECTNCQNLDLQKKSYTIFITNTKIY